MRSNMYSILALLSITFFSCTKQDGPINPSESESYLGGIGTQRTYTKTEWWLNSDTNVPFLAVHDSVRTRVSLSAAQIRAGVCDIQDFTETLTAVSDEYYTGWYLPLERTSYRQINGVGVGYNLADEIDNLLNGRSYVRPTVVSGPEIFQMLPDSYLTVGSPDLQSQFPSMPYVVKPLRLHQSWTRWRWLDTTTGQAKQETIARVVGLERVTVPAGSFIAYKVELTHFWYNPLSSYSFGFEYYVPNVGLILKESDMLLSQWNSGTGQTISFRRVLRQELQSYNFVVE